MAPQTRDEAINDINQASRALATACTNAVNLGVSIAEVMTLASQALVNPLGGGVDAE